jgi:hypothetical protein
MLVVLSWTTLAATADAATPEKVRADAESAFVAARFDEADRGYATMLAKQPKDTLALLRRGQIALFSNRLAAARPLIEKARASGATPIRVASLLGEISYRQDDYATAAAQFKLAGREAKAAKLASFGASRPWRIEGPDSVAIPMIQVDPLPLVSMTVNGRGPYFFLIDTGGSELALDPALADTLGLATYGEEMGTFAGGRKSSVTQSRLDSLNLGPLTVRGVPLALLDTKRFAPIAMGRPVAGVIGTVFLYHFRATLDYPHARLVLVRRGSPPATGQIEIPFWIGRRPLHGGVRHAGFERGEDLVRGLGHGGAGVHRSGLDVARRRHPAPGHGQRAHRHRRRRARARRAVPRAAPDPGCRRGRRPARHLRCFPAIARARDGIPDRRPGLAWVPARVERDVRLRPHALVLVKPA